jgi:HD superfamily phosphohydrolase YqeK
MRIYILITFAILSFATSLRFLENTNSFEDQVRGFNLNELKKIALGFETYDRSEKGIVLLGGLHDYIDSLSDRQITGIIFDYVKVYPDFKSVDALKKKFLTQVLLVATEDDLKVKLTALPRTKLVGIALALERESRKAKGQEKLLGGLHDYIDRLTDGNIVDIIIDYSKDLADYKTYDKLLSLINTAPLEISAITERLNKKTKEELAHIGIAADEYDRRRSDTLRLGGLHDYVWRLEKNDIISIIISYCKKWPELLQEQYFSEILDVKSDETHNIIGGFEDYVWKLDKEDLIACALACEEYDRNKMGIKILGGLHDYINSLNDDQIIKILTDYIHKYPELRLAGVIEKIAKIPVGGFFSYLDTFSDDQLREVCVILEKYDREVRGVTLLGGIHDYVDTLTRERLVEYIKNKADYYPEIRKEGKLVSILTKYNKH